MESITKFKFLRGQQLLCCICNEEITDGFGNNPIPVSYIAGERCCDECNNQVILPNRIQLLRDNGVIEPIN